MKNEYEKIKAGLVAVHKKDEVVRMMLKKRTLRGIYPLEFLEFIEAERAITRRNRKRRSYLQVKLKRLE